MSETAAAIRELIKYMKQAEIRQTIGTDRASVLFNNEQNSTKIRYLAALESGQDQEFVDALESSPCPHSFVVKAMGGRKK